MNATIRWMIRRDFPAVLKIESACFCDPWDEDEFIRHLREKNRIGMVAEHGERIVGYMLYELQKGGIVLHNFAVDPQWWRRGIGTQLIEKLKSKLSAGRRARLKMAVRESNLGGQIFLRANGFRCISTLRGELPDTGEDAYVFQFHAAQLLAAVS